MNDFTGVKIAVDFDGTIVEHEYPAIGKEKLFAFQTLKELEKKGALLILWTFRTGKELEEAVDFFTVELNFTLECFMAAMFAPCLTDCLKFDVGGAAFFLFKISLNFF